MSEEPATPPLEPATQVAHLGREPAQFLGAINTPVFRASTIVFPRRPAHGVGARSIPASVTACTDCRRCRISIGRRHARRRHAALAVLGADRDDAAAARAAAAGHVLVTDSVYGPTRRFANHLARYGVEAATTTRSPVPRSSVSSAPIRASCSPNRRLADVRIQDVPAIVAVAHARGQVILDNSWATPLFPRVRPRRRRLGARRHQVHRRPLRRSPRPYRGQRGDVSRPCIATGPICNGVVGRFSQVAQFADAGDPSRAVGERARIAQWLPRGRKWGGDLSRARRRARSRSVETRFRARAASSASLQPVSASARRDA